MKNILLLCIAFATLSITSMEHKKNLPATSRELKAKIAASLKIQAEKLSAQVKEERSSRRMRNSYRSANEQELENLQWQIEGLAS